VQLTQNNHNCQSLWAENTNLMHLLHLSLFS